MRARGAMICALLVAALAACEVDDQGEIVLPDRDAATFAADVQPFLGSGCGSLDCHGDPGRPLRLYAVHGLRTSAALRGEEITDDELTANVAALAAQPVERLLGKPLALATGGMKHLGGDRWADSGVAEYRCFAAWLDGDTDATACATAVENAPY